MEAELLQRLRRMGLELEQLRVRLQELHAIQHHLRTRYGPHFAAERGVEPPGAPIAVGTGLEEFLRAYA